MGGGFLPRRPQDIRADDEHAKVNTIAGQCNKDGSPYTLGFIPEAADGGFNRSTFNFILRDRLIDIFAPRVNNDPKILQDVEEAMKLQFTPWPHFNDMVTDVGFGDAQDRINKQNMNDGKDVYYYIMSYRSREADWLVPEWIGVPHNGELPYVMGWPHIKLNPELRIETEMYFEVIIDWDETDVEYADFMMDLWTNFAKTGNPTSSPVMKPDDSGEAMEWPAYQTNEGMPYVDIGPSVDLKRNYRQKYFAFWQEYLPYITGIDTYEAASSFFSGLQSESSENIDEMMARWVQEALEEKQQK